MDVQQIIEEVNKSGIFVVENFLKNKQPVVDEFDTIFSNIPDRSQGYLNRAHNLELDPPGSYELGKHLRVQPAAYSNIPEIYNTFQNQDLINITNGCLGRNVYGMQIFMSTEYNPTTNKEKYPRNALLHFDPYESLKFILYLTDTDETSGAFHAIPGSLGEGRKYRTEKMNIQDMSGWNSGYRHQPSDYDEDPKYSQEDAVAYGGNVGDLIIVHTDTLHYGSIILEPNKERKVVLLHCRPQ
tara:strand:- start:248 stop:970 length:723 start_codon:yes stop_codon:yes gene_type:complete